MPFHYVAPKVGNHGKPTPSTGHKLIERERPVWSGLLRSSNWIHIQPAEIKEDQRQIAQLHSLTPFYHFCCLPCPLQSRIGFVGQEPILFNSTVRENILYGMEKAGNATGQGEIAGV